MCADGHTYDRDNIERWFAGGHSTSLNFAAHLPHLNIVPNHALRNSIEDFLNSSFREIARGRFSLGRRLGTGASKLFMGSAADGSCVDAARSMVTRCRRACETRLELKAARGKFTRLPRPLEAEKVVSLLLLTSTKNIVDSIVSRLDSELSALESDEPDFAIVLSTV